MVSKELLQKAIDKLQLALENIDEWPHRKLANILRLAQADLSKVEIKAKDEALKKAGL